MKTQIARLAQEQGRLGAAPGVVSPYTLCASLTIPRVYADVNLVAA